MTPSDHAPWARTIELTDAELLGLVRAGTTGAFATFYVRHNAELVDRIAKNCPRLSSPQVLTVAAEAFLSVLKNLLAKPGNELRSDLLAEVVRVAESVARERLPNRPAESTPPKNPGARIHQIAPTFWQPIAESFASLPEHWRRIIWLTRVERLPNDITAMHLGSDSRRVRWLGRRAERAFRIEWQRNLREKNWSRRAESSDSGHSSQTLAGSISGDDGSSSSGEAPRSRSDSRFVELVSDFRIALIHAVLRSPALIEQLADILAIPPTTNLGSAQACDHVSPIAVGSPARDPRHHGKYHLLDEPTTTTRSRFRSAPTLVLAVAGVAAMCVTLLMLGMKWSTSDEDAVPAGRLIDESSTSPQRPAGPTGEETTAGQTSSSRSDSANEKESPQQPQSSWPSGQRRSPSDDATSSSDRSEPEPASPARPDPPVDGGPSSPETSGPSTGDSPVGEPSEPSRSAGPTPTDETEPPPTQDPGPSDEPESPGTEEPSDGSESPETEGPRESAPTQD